MKRRVVLLNPGPVNVTERVRRASVAAGDLCHREEEYRRLARRIRGLLLRVFAPKSYTAVLLTGSGTAAVEAMVVSAASPGGKLLVVENGVYGERMGRMAEAHGIPTVRLKSGWLEPPDLDELARLLKRDRKIAAVALVHHETTTGLLNPVEEVGRIARRYGRMLILDAVSSLAAEPLDLARSGVAGCACTANKALQGLPGVSFVLVRSGLMRKMAKWPRRSVYLHLPDYHRADELGTVPFTPAVPAAFAFAEALEELLEEGVARRIERIKGAADLLRRGFFDMGLEMLLPPEIRANALTALRLPKGITYKKLHDELKRKGFVIYAGQGALAKNIFRVANIGDLKREELDRFLRDLGCIVGRGRKKKARTVDRAIILAAGAGKRFGARGRRVPKCLLTVGGETLLARHLKILARTGVRDVIIVTGYRAGEVRREASRAARSLRGLKVRFVENTRFERGGLLSLHAARRFIDRPIVLMDADVYYGARLMRRLVESKEENAFLLDASAGGDGEEMMLVARAGRVVEISRRPSRRGGLAGEGVGFLKLGKSAARRLATEAARLVEAGGEDEEYEAVVARLLRRVRVGYERADDLPWAEIDFPADLARAERELRPRMGPED